MSFFVVKLNWKEEILTVYKDEGSEAALLYFKVRDIYH